MPAYSRLVLAALAAAAAAITASGADANALNPFADANRAELSVDFGRRGRRLAAGADAHIPGMVVDLTLDPTPGVAAPALPVYHGLPAARALRAAANATDDEGLGGPAARRLAARPFYTRHGRTEAQCANDINTYKAQGYVVASLAVFYPSSPKYSYVLMKPASTPAPYVTILNVGLSSFTTSYQSLIPQGYVMRHLAIVGSGSGARYSANFDKEPTSSWVFSLSMTETEFGQQNAAQRTAGRMLTAVTLYGGSAAADRRYGAVWVANPGAVTWAAFVTSAAEFNGFAAGMAAAPMRATHMIPAPNNAVAVSVWVDTTLGQWKAVIRVSSSEYQAAYDAAIADGYLPVGAIGGGSATSGIRYGGIFAKNNDAPFPRVWSQTATAPSSSASNALAVDNAVKAYMKATGVRSALFAISKNVGGFKSVAFSRAYTWAEASYPKVATTSILRLASVSKAFCAAAIDKLVKEGKLALTDKVFPKLGITKAYTGMTPDSRINTITVQHLLNHQGGWLTNSSTSNPEFRLNAIAQQLGLCDTCSLSKAQLARFSFGLPLQFTPGTQNLGTTNFLSYSNMGYILLGLLVEKVQPLSFTDYVRSAILAPIGVTDVYRARTAQNLRAANEGYYQSTGAGYTALRRLDVSQALGEQVPFAHGGRNYATETMDSGGGLMSTATALSQFAQTYASWGTGGPSGSRIGSMAGTVSRMAYLGGTQKLSVAYILNGGVAGANTAFDASFEAMIASRTW